MSDLKTVTADQATKETIAEIARSIPPEQLKRVQTIKPPKRQRPKRGDVKLYKPQSGLRSDGMPDRRTVHGRRIIERMQTGEGKTSELKTPRLQMRLYKQYTIKRY